jgi:predicted RNA-binding protein
VPTGCLINLLSSSHPHFRSFLAEGLWGFPDNKVNRRRWSLLEPGGEALLYFEHRGVKGVWGLARVVEVFERREPVDYWVERPSGFPLQVRLELVEPVRCKPSPGSPIDISWFDGVTPLRKEEAAALGVKLLKPRMDRWSLIVFNVEAAYSSEIFERLKNEFTSRNRRVQLRKLSHEEVKEILAEMGRMQGKYVNPEEPIDEKRLDVAWRRIQRGVPYAVFEVCIGGDLYADLMKLKHAVDLWNSIAVLVTTRDRVEEARKWIEGALHEVAQNFRIVTVEEVVELYERKRSYKELEAKLGLV